MTTAAKAAVVPAIAAHSPGREQPATRLALADRLLAETAATSLAPAGHWQRSAEDQGLDTSLLLGAIRGFRFQPDGLPLGQAEGAFPLCGFWLALAYAQQGDQPRALSWFERNRAACGTPGLLSEEFDVRQRQLRGNLPQAFVHALLLECAVRLARS